MSFTQPIEGYCPMGCGQTLVIHDGCVTCQSPECPRPSAVAEILADSETNHVAEITEDSFTLGHPLRERLDGDLFGCPVWKALHALSEPPWPPGRYRVRQDDEAELGVAIEAIT